MAGSHQDQESHHPTFRQYVLIAVILFAITIVEFLLIYPEAQIVNHLGASKIPLLVALSAVKFAIVIMFYMHLKFDNRLLGGIFLSGLGLGFAVVVAVLVLFFALQGNPRSYAEARAVPYEEHHEEEPEPVVVAQTPDTGSPSVETATTPSGTEPATGGSGGDTDALIAQGQEIFVGVGGCAACHTIDGVAAGLVGPDQTHIGTEAATRKPGLSAREYITESIRDPEAFVPTGVERALPGVMTPALTANLTDNQVNALVEFLLAQK